MKYSEAKQYLKKGMEVTVNNHTGKITSLDFNEAGSNYLNQPIQLDNFWCYGGKVTPDTEITIIRNPDGTLWRNSSWQEYEQRYNPSSNDYFLSRDFMLKTLFKAMDNHRTKEKKKGYMSTIVSKIKDLALSQTDRTLRKHSLEDNNGKLTSEARDMMLDELVTERWATRREQIASDIQKVEAEEKGE